jgi:2-amino-4-hydroxy-6-hydroxymethyldihydropteridine diphosphokinase
LRPPADDLAWVGLGSNLGESRRILTEAAAELESWSRLPLTRSSLWRSSPVDCPPGSPDFLNAVVGLTPAPDETPERLLARLLRLERARGRRPKTTPNEPRPLDLDLLAFGRETCETAQLILPHPRAHLRRFVLVPWNEVAPDLILPGKTATVAELLARLRTDEQVVCLGPW